jgi:hypothetical protein
MNRLRFRLPSPALVVAVIALIIALGGTSYAAFTLPSGSVGTKQLKNKAVTNGKLAANSVGTQKIRNGAVTGPKMNFSGVSVPNALQANNANQLGGAPASAYLSGYQRVIGSPSSFDTTQAKFLSISCPPGKKLIALGVSGIAYFGTLPAIIPQFNSDTSGSVIAQKYDGQAYNFAPEAVCANG